MVMEFLWEKIILRKMRDGAMSFFSWKKVDFTRIYEKRDGRDGRDGTKDEERWGDSDGIFMGKKNFTKTKMLSWRKVDFTKIYEKSDGRDGTKGEERW